jgi:hypothetical protein
MRVRLGADSMASTRQWRYWNEKSEYRERGREGRRDGKARDKKKAE